LSHQSQQNCRPTIAKIHLLIYRGSWRWVSPAISWGCLLYNSGSDFSRVQFRIYAHPRDLPEPSRTCPASATSDDASSSSLTASSSSPTASTHITTLFLTYYVTNIYHWIRNNEQNTNITIKSIITKYIGTRGAPGTPACPEARNRPAGSLLVRPREFPQLSCTCPPSATSDDASSSSFQRAHRRRQRARILQHYS
jgi:hypothetical protein